MGCIHPIICYYSIICKSKERFLFRSLKTYIGWCGQYVFAPFPSRKCALMAHSKSEGAY